MKKFLLLLCALLTGVGVWAETWVSVDNWEHSSGGNANVNYFGIVAPSTADAWDISSFKIYTLSDGGQTRYAAIVSANPNSTSTVAEADVVAISSNTVTANVTGWQEFTLTETATLLGGETYYIVFLTSNVATNGNYTQGLLRCGLYSTTYAPKTYWNTSGTNAWACGFTAEITENTSTSIAYVTYVVKDENGNVLLTSEPVVTTMGANITTLPSDYQLTNFYTYNTVDVTISQTNTTVEFTATLKDTPNFKFTSDATNPIWHKLKMKDANYPTYKAEETPNVAMPTTDANDQTVQWAFIGNPYAGFTIINRAAGTDLVLGSASAVGDGNTGANTLVTLAAPGSRTCEKFFAYHSGRLTNGFFLFNAEGHAMNLRDGKLAYWTGGYDLGSTFVATEVLEGEALYNELLAEVQAINYGAGLGQYTLTGILEGYAGNEAALIALIESTYGGIDYVTGAEALQAMIDNKALNMPKAGFYRIKGNTSDKYLAAGYASNGKFNMTDATDGTTVLYYDGTTLVNVATGLANGMNKDTWAWGTAASTVTFLDGNTNGGYAIYSTSAYFYDNGDNSASTDRGATVDLTTGNTRYRSWSLEEVTTLPVAVSAAEYATLYAPVALTIAQDVTVYTISAVAEGKATLAEVEGTTIPAETAVILKAAEGTYNFAITEDVAAISGNLLEGVVAPQAWTNEFTLQTSDLGVGLFSKEVPYLAAFKAYLPANNAAGVKGILFDTETAVKSIEAAENTEKAIFDLSGRRVEKPVRGLYIVGGKKVIVK